MADTVRRADYYYVTVPHRAGEGARVLDAFRDAGVDFLAVHAFPEGEEAQIDLFPADREAFLRAAEAAGIELSPRKTAFLIRGTDRPGAVAETLQKLAGAGVNITAMDAVSSGDRFGALVWVDPEQMDRAAEALEVE